MQEERISDLSMAECNCGVCSLTPLMRSLCTKGVHCAAFANESTLTHDYGTKNNHSVFKRGQRFAATNFFSVCVAHLVGLFALLAVPTISRVLSQTGKSSSPRKALQRYYGTLMHLKKWYTTEDILQTKSSGHLSLLEVRQKHACAAERLQTADPSLLNTTQTQLTITQWAFVAPIVLQPRLFGISEPENIQDFVHFWKVIGTIMGIEDRFNLCRGSLENVTAECTSLLHRIIRPCLLEPSSTSLSLMQSMLEGVSQLVPAVRPHAFTQYVFYILRVPNKSTHIEGSNWIYKINVWLLKDGFHVFLLGTFLRSLCNFLMHFCLMIENWKRKIKKNHHICIAKAMQYFVNFKTKTSIKLYK